MMHARPPPLRDGRRKQSARKPSLIGRGTSSIIGDAAQGSFQDELTAAPSKDHFHELIELVVAEHDRQVEELRDGGDHYYIQQSSTNHLLPAGFLRGSLMRSCPASARTSVQQMLVDSTSRVASARPSMQQTLLDVMPASPAPSMNVSPPPAPALPMDVTLPPSPWASVDITPRPSIGDQKGSIISSIHAPPSVMVLGTPGDDEDSTPFVATTGALTWYAGIGSPVGMGSPVTDASDIPEKLASRCSEITDTLRSSVRNSELSLQPRRNQRRSTLGDIKMLLPCVQRLDRRTQTMPAGNTAPSKTDVAIDAIRKERRSCSDVQLADSIADQDGHRPGSVGEHRPGSVGSKSSAKEQEEGLDDLTMPHDERKAQKEFVTRELWLVKSLHKVPDIMPLPRSSSSNVIMGMFQAEHYSDKSKSRSRDVVSESPTQEIDPMAMINDNTYIRAMISSPSSTHRLLWDMLGLLFLLADIVLLPLEAFEDKGVFDDYVLYASSMVFWTCDMPLSLVVGYISKGQTEMRFTKIASHYMRTWFPVDVIVNGWDWAFLILKSSSGFSSKLGRHVRLVRFLRLIRLVRMFKMTRVVSQINDRFTSEYLSIIANIFKLVILLLLVNHLIACIWYWLGAIDRRDTWIKRFIVDDATLAWCYFTSLHWSLTQFTPGSMDLQPQNESERIFNVGVLVFGLVVFSGFVSSMTNHFMRLKALVSDQSQQFWLLRSYLRHHQISPNLSARIHRHIEFWVKHQTQALSQSSVKLLDVISKDLRNELNFELLKEPVMVHPYFANLVKLSDVVAHRLCERTMYSSMFMRHDHIFFAGEVACNTFLIRTGRALYHKVSKGDLEDTSSRESVDTLTSYLSKAKNDTKSFSNDYDSCENSGAGNLLYVQFGYVICEPTLWTAAWTHCGKLTAAAESDVVTIGAAGFVEVLKNSPSVLGFTRHYSQNYMRWLNSFNRADLTDIVNIENEMYHLDSFVQSLEGGLQDDHAHISGVRGLFTNLLRTSFNSHGHRERMDTIRSLETSTKESATSVSSHPSRHGTWCSCCRKRSLKSVGPSDYLKRSDSCRSEASAPESEFPVDSSPASSYQR